MKSLVDCLGLINVFVLLVFGYRKVYIRKPKQMFDYSKMSNEVGSSSGSGMKCTL